MSLLNTLATAVQPWADAYSSSKVLETGVLFSHFAGLLVGGGFAMATDRLVLRSRRAPWSDPDARARVLAEIHSVHRPVLIGLTLTIATGALLLAADVETLMAMPIFWVKMAVLVALLANGWVMRRTEQRLLAASDGAGGSGGTATDLDWRRLRLGAAASFTLWLAVTLGGVWLSNA